MTDNTHDASTIYLLKITLADLTPEVWRRVEVPSDITLARLHRVIQTAFGWENSHLHQFESALARKHTNASFSPRPRLKDTSSLAQVAPGEHSEFSYVYDFGDNWEHHILVEAIAAADEGVTYPRCIGGQWACPPEDCGGTPGYDDILNAIRHPDRPDAAELLDWVGDHFDPTVFDLGATNLALTRLGRRVAASR